MTLGPPEPEKTVSIQQRVRECLAEGPTTSSEVAATLGLSIRNACARLRHLEAQRQAVRIGMVGKAILFAAR